MNYFQSSNTTGKGKGLLVFSMMLFFLFAFQFGNAQTNTFPPTGYVGIGTTTPGFALTAIGTEWNSSQISLTTYAGTPTPGGTDNYTPQFRFEKARGSAAVSTKVEEDDRIGAFLAAGYDGSKMQRSAVFGFRVDGPTAVGDVPIGFFVQTGNSSANKPERLLVTSTGEVLIGGDVALGSITDPDGHGLNAQSYSSGKAAVRGVDQNGTSLYAEGMLGVLSVGSLGLSGAPYNGGVVGVKPAQGANGAGVVGWNLDNNSSNYAGYFVSDGTGTDNYAVYGRARNATGNNYAGYFDGLVQGVSDGTSNTIFLAEQNSSAVSGTHYGVRVNNNPSTTSESQAFYAERTSGADGSRVGYRNYMTGGTGTRYGVSSSIYADVTNNSTIYGVYSFISSSATTGTSYAGYFSNSGGSYATYAVGDSYVSGDLRVGTTVSATGYKLSVNGKAAVEELLIDDSGFWPDYVFEDDYELMSLEEIEASIETNGHLPGMPSALEVEENGILVGDMQKKTVEKVEELTLHLIEMNKRLKALEAENTELKSQLSK